MKICFYMMLKFYLLFSIFSIVVSCNTLPRPVHPKENKIDMTITKREESSEECKYINSMIEKDESYNCCTHTGIKCSNGHIISM